MGKLLYLKPLKIKVPLKIKITALFDLMVDSIIKQITQLKSTRYLNIYFTKEYIQMANKHIERYTTSCHWGMQISTTMSYHYTPIRIAKIQNADNTKCWQGCGTTGTHSLLMRVWSDTVSLEHSLMISYKTKHTLTI